MHESQHDLLLLFIHCRGVYSLQSMHCICMLVVRANSYFPNCPSLVVVGYIVVTKENEPRLGLDAQVESSVMILYNLTLPSHTMATHMVIMRRALCGLALIILSPA